MESRPTADLDAELVLKGRIAVASNATFFAEIGETAVVYKPIAGENPLWDFPDGTLAEREVAAHLVSEAFGWNVVPLTWLRDGPRGPGMVQLWQDIDENQDAVDLVAAASMPETGWRRVLDGTDEHDREVSLIHEDGAALRRMCIFDIVVNNADRKGGHILAMPNGHRHGVDHGLTFHAEHKLRTVLWGFADEDLTPEELADVDRVRSELSAELGDALSELITTPELDALDARCERLLSRGTFPEPHGSMPAVPWPLF